MILLTMLKKSRGEPKLAREGLVQGVALVCLLVLAGFSLAGPSGVLAWAENQRLLAERRTEIVKLAKERDELRNLYRKEIFPVILPLLQIARAEERRIVFTAVPFRKAAVSGD